MSAKLLGILFILFLLMGCESEQATVSSAQAVNDPYTPVTDTAPTAYDIFPTNILEDSQSGWIFLAYTDPENHEATSCQISNRAYVNIASPCVCSYGVCRVKVSGFENYSGPATFKYSITANNMTSGTANAAFFVVALSDAPVSYDHTVVTMENTVYTSNGTMSLPNLKGSDPDSDPVTCIKVSNPSQGAAVVNPDCTFTYTPPAIFVGTTSFTFKVNDGFIDSNISTVNITVLRPNVAPVAVNDSVTTYQNKITPITLSASDLNGDQLEYTIVTAPTKGSLAGTGASRVYVPKTNYIGTDSFTFRVDDGVLASGTATVLITVNSAVLHLSTTGNDSTAEINNPSKPFLTAQAAVDAAIAFAPSAVRPLTINLGSGSFGNFVINSNFGSDITWKGFSSGLSSIGNITVNAASGTPGVAVGDPAVGAWNGGNGINGKIVTITSDFSLSFGNVTVNGGNGGLHAPDIATKKAVPGTAGKGGTVKLKGYFNAISALGGDGHGGAAGGTVILQSGSTAASINASGGLDLCTTALSCHTSVSSGNGGIVITEAGTTVNGTITANGGENKGDGGLFSTVAGMGGTIKITGFVLSHVYAYGGNSNDSQVGEGGRVEVLAGANVNGHIYLQSGSSSGTAEGLAAGNAEIKGNVQNVYAQAHSVLGGSAGEVRLYGTALNIYVNSPFVTCSYASAGEAYIYVTGQAANVYAQGGNELCSPSTGGYIQVSGKTTGNISVAGGDNVLFADEPGKAGRIVLYPSAIVNTVSAAGGNAAVGSCKDGGSGGSIEVYSGASYNIANFTVTGGTGDTGCGRANGAFGTITNL